MDTVPASSPTDGSLHTSSSVARSDADSACSKCRVLSASMNSCDDRVVCVCVCVCVCVFVLGECVCVCVWVIGQV